MNPRTIKAIDFWCGVPLCLAFTIVARIGRLLAARGRRGGVARSVLFLKLTEQGAIVLAYPALTRAAQMVGRSNLWFCVFPEHRQIVDLLDVVPRDHVLEVRHANLFVFLSDVVRFAVRARRAGIDAVIDLEFFSRASALLGYLSGARTRVGYHRYTSEYPYRGDLMTHRVQYNPYLHTARASLLLVEALDLDPAQVPLPKIAPPPEALSPPRFVPSEEQRRRVAELLGVEARGPVDRPIVLVNANAGDMLPLRKWPPERFRELVARLLAAFDTATVVLTGAPAERPAVERIFEGLPPERIVNLAGKTDVADLITLFGLADVLVTNDSGPGHFAAMTGVHCVVLFGPETPLLYAPLGANVHVVYRALACSPCVNVFNHRFSPCSDNVCMSGIDVSTVFDRVRAVLSPRGSAVEGQG